MNLLFYIPLIPIPPNIKDTIYTNCYYLGNLFFGWLYTQFWEIKEGSSYIILSNSLLLYTRFTPVLYSFYPINQLLYQPFIGLSYYWVTLLLNQPIIYINRLLYQPIIYINQLLYRPVIDLTNYSINRLLGYPIIYPTDYSINQLFTQPIIYSTNYPINQLYNQMIISSPELILHYIVLYPFPNRFIRLLSNWNLPTPIQFIFGYLFLFYIKRTQFFLYIIPTFFIYFYTPIYYKAPLYIHLPHSNIYKFTYYGHWFVPIRYHSWSISSIWGGSKR